MSKKQSELEQHMDNPDSELDEKLNKDLMNVISEMSEMLRDKKNESFATNLHSEADQITEQALQYKDEGNLHLFYEKIDLARCLRTTANYLEGVNAGAG